MADLLFTEPVVALFSVSCPISHVDRHEPNISFQLWIGFAWGILYVFASYVFSLHDDRRNFLANIMARGIEPIFQNLHHFGAGATGLVYITYPSVVTCYVVHQSCAQSLSFLQAWNRLGRSVERLSRKVISVCGTVRGCVMEYLRVLE